MKSAVIAGAGLTSGFGFARGQSVAAGSKQTAKPNVILIMTDDQGYGDLSCHGNPVLKTPNLDRLHSQSTRFTDFHVAPFCSPTHWSNPRSIGR